MQQAERRLNEYQARKHGSHKTAPLRSATLFARLRETLYEIGSTVEEFGVKFNSGSDVHFEALKRLFEAVKKDKDDESSRDESEWINFIPEELRPNFIWPTEVERSEWQDFSKDKPVAIPDVAHQLSEKWDFYSIIDAFHNGDYDLLKCERIAESYEMHIYPYGYPYGGIGPLIALAEGFGFQVVGVNEYGKYLDRSELKIGG